MAGHNLAVSTDLKVRAYRADGAVLLAYDLPQALTPGLAGFAIQCTRPDGKAYYLRNPLSLTKPVTQDTPQDNQDLDTSDKAPIQKFRWVYFTSFVMPGAFTFTVTAMYFKTDGSLTPGTSGQVAVELSPIRSGPLSVGFTRGFLTSQSYARNFNNAPFEPDRMHKTIDFDTTPYQAQYQWLGHTARQMMFDFLDECLADPTITLDLFAYDLDEPDILSKLVKLGPRLRAVLDNAPLHTKPHAMEPLAAQALQKSAGAGNIVQGHFNRFSHSKVLIQKKNGTPVKVLAGSANFSVRGLYVQANNVMVFTDQNMAGHYENAFQVAFTGMSSFRKQPISQSWFSLPAAGSNPYAVSFSPHADSSLSLKVVADAVANARSSVLFAVMELSGGGTVMTDLLNLGSRPDLFSYGITQSSAGIHLYPPSQPNAILTNFAALDANMPAPFKQEWRGGEGQVIHHKFVVVDFNGSSPAVFTGSSNLSSGGEMDNGDNLVAIYDPVVVEAYAVEAVRLVDHYHFRAKQAAATHANPLLLKPAAGPGQEWWQPYYDPNNIKCRDRQLFA